MTELSQQNCPRLPLPLLPLTESHLSGLLAVSRDFGASEEWLDTSSMSSKSGIEDGMSIGSARSDHSPKHCVALYDYTVSTSVCLLQLWQ